MYGIGMVVAMVNRLSCYGNNTHCLLTLMRAFTLAVVFKAIDLSLFYKEKTRSLKLGIKVYSYVIDRD